MHDLGSHEKEKREKSLRCEASYLWRGSHVRHMLCITVCTAGVQGCLHYALCNMNGLTPQLLYVDLYMVPLRAPGVHACLVRPG